MEEGFFLDRVRLTDHTYRFFRKTSGMDRNRQFRRLYLVRGKFASPRLLFPSRILHLGRFPSPWARNGGTSREKNEPRLRRADLGWSDYFDNTWGEKSQGSFLRGHLAYLQPFDSCQKGDR